MCRTRLNYVKYTDRHVRNCAIHEQSVFPRNSLPHRTVGVHKHIRRLQLRKKCQTVLLCQKALRVVLLLTRCRKRHIRLQHSCEYRQRLLLLLLLEFPAESVSEAAWQSRLREATREKNEAAQCAQRDQPHAAQDQRQPALASSLSPHSSSRDKDPFSQTTGTPRFL